MQPFRRILTYFPLADELPLLAAVEREAKPLYLPCLEGEGLAFRLYSRPGEAAATLISGKYGIKEPLQGEKLTAVDTHDLLLVPALGANSEGTRLGRGGGYYDRARDFLAASFKLAVLPMACTALSFKTEEHDMRLDLILTETKSIEFR